MPNPPNQSNAKLAENSTAVWLLRLELARAENRFADAAEAQAKLRALGVEVIYRRKGAPPAGAKR